MSEATVTTERPEEVQPIMGPLARGACALPIEGSKRRKLVVLIAAYADAGVCHPSTHALLERIPEMKGSAKKLYGCVRRLQEDGLIRQLPKNSGFELLFPGADPGAQSQPESE